MKFESVRLIFNTFFPDKQYQTISDSEGNIEFCTIEENKKFSVKYTEVDNHLQILEWDWNNEFPVNTIVEGSPEDIIKLSKILEK